MVLAAPGPLLTPPRSPSPRRPLSGPTLPQFDPRMKRRTPPPKPYLPLQTRTGHRQSHRLLKYRVPHGSHPDGLVVGSCTSHPGVLGVRRRNRNRLFAHRYLVWNTRRHGNWNKNCFINGNKNLLYPQIPFFLSSRAYRDPTVPTTQYNRLCHVTLYHTYPLGVNHQVARTFSGDKKLGTPCAHQPTTGAPHPNHRHHK
jgi:hypothetical protein